MTPILLTDEVCMPTPQYQREPITYEQQIIVAARLHALEDMNPHVRNLRAKRSHREHMHNAWVRNGR